MLIDEIRNIKSERKDLRNFGLVVGGVFFAIGCLLYWFEKPTYLYTGVPGIVLMAAGLIMPTVLLPLQKVWMSLAVVMGWFMTRVILSLLFFLVITPLGFILKLGGKRLLREKIDRECGSYWIRREAKPFDKEAYKRQF